MKITVVFDPEDGTGPLYKTRSFPGIVQAVHPPGMLWYELVKAMKELIHTWQWTRAGKPPWDDREKRIAWKDEARVWTEPIDVMIAASSRKE